MKKELYITLFLFSISLKVLSQVYIYPIERDGVEWKNYENVSERIEALQLPDNYLDSTNTDDLLETCLSFPYLLDIFFYDNLDEGLKYLSEEFNGIRWLNKRNDLAFSILRKLDNLDIEIKNIDYKLRKADLSFGFFFMEYLLSRDSIISQLDKNGLETLLETLSSNLKIKESYPDIFGNLNKRMSIDLISKIRKTLNIDVQSSKLMSSLQDYSPTTIYTPYGSVVPDAYVYNYDDDDYSIIELEGFESYLSSNFNGAILLAPPSNKYNCHGFAWHVSEGGNKVWINGSESVYWYDGSYSEVNESSATKVSYAGDHSAIRVNSDWYISKWGSSCLVKHHPNAVPTGYLPGLPKTYYKNSMFISGQSTICDSATYYINGLQSNMSVAWTTGNQSIANDTSIFLVNYPQQNQCTIASNYEVACSDTLKALIYVGSNHTCTLWKTFTTSSIFYCDLSAHGPNGAVAFPLVASATDGDQVRVGIGDTIRMYSPKIRTMSISYSGYTPSFFDVDNTNGYITFVIPQNRKQILISGNSFSSCESFLISFYTGPLIIVIDPIESTLNISIYSDEDEDNGSNQSKDCTWKLEAYNVETNSKILDKGFIGNRGKLDISSWKKGMYIFRVIKDGQIVTKTVQIR